MGRDDEIHAMYIEEVHAINIYIFLIEVRARGLGTSRVHIII